VAPVHHQNRTQRGSRANDALVCIDHFQIFCKDCPHPWNTSPRSFPPRQEWWPRGPEVKLTTRYGWLWVGWKSPDIMASVSSGENHRTLWLEWVFGFPINALTLYKLTKLHWFIVFVFQFGGAWCIVWVGLDHQIPPVATGLAVCETWKSIAVPRSIWLLNNCRKAFAHFGQVYLMCRIFVKKCPFWARLINVAQNCNENRNFSCLNLIYFYCSLNHKLEMWFCSNLKSTTNDVYWRKFWIFLYFFVHLLRALPIFLFGKLLLFFII